MGLPPEALALENQAIGFGGKRTLADAFQRCADAWRSGDRDRELGLHLMFLAWYLLVEPPHLTGLDESRTPSAGLASLFREVHAQLEERLQADAEMLYVVGLMAALCPWCIDPDHIDAWEQRARDHRIAYRALAPGGIPAKLFEGRGYYGHYFASQARVANGY